jgi:hypothetical protein
MNMNYSLNLENVLYFSFSQYMDEGMISHNLVGSFSS